MDLDRTIPFYNVIMRCDSVQINSINLPEGYYFKTYEEGYEDAWAQMEYDIGDFNSVMEAKEYFIKKYMTDIEEIKTKCIFILDQSNKAVGSCIAWHDAKDERSVASIHWLVVLPEHQSKGLGKALCKRVMRIYEESNDVPIYIHTQPWSYKAILLYISLGFYLQKNDTFSGYDNQYEEALEVLKGILTAEQYKYVIRFSQE